MHGILSQILGWVVIIAALLLLEGTSRGFVRLLSLYFNMIPFKGLRLMIGRLLSVVLYTILITVVWDVTGGAPMHPLALFLALCGAYVLLWLLVAFG